MHLAAGLLLSRDMHCPAASCGQRRAGGTAGRRSCGAIPPLLAGLGSRSVALQAFVPRMRQGERCHARQAAHLPAAGHCCWQPASPGPPAWQPPRGCSAAPRPPYLMPAAPGQMPRRQRLYRLRPGSVPEAGGLLVTEIWTDRCWTHMFDVRERRTVGFWQS